MSKMYLVNLICTFTYICICYFFVTQLLFNLKITDGIRKVLSIGT